MPLSLFLLGPPRVEIDGEAIAFPRQKSLALLVHLAVTGEQQRRDSLAARLWPESADARGSLRRELSSLKRALGDGDWLTADRENVTLTSDARLDVDDFLAAARSDDPARWQLAADLYRDNFLTGFSLADAPEFDDWQFFQAEEYRRVCAATLERLLAHFQAAGDPDAAIPYARRLLALDNLHEPSHRILMRLYALAGQQSAALRQYDECVRLFDEELGVPPEAETTELHEAIRTRRFPAEDDKVTRGQDDKMTVAGQPGIPSSGHLVIPSPLHNLPPQATPFVGRRREVEAVRGLLAEPVNRLVTITGVGGMGKSRLGLAVAEALRGAFPDGVWFVPLAALDSAEVVPRAIAGALAAPMGDGNSRALLLHFLREKQLLLLLDNFEHLLDGADFLAELLGSATGVKLLVTSQERLNLLEESLYPLGGLDEAARLFVERAQRMQPDFDPTAQGEAIASICRLVEGMPLAIELAASWVRVMACAEIAAEIQRSADFLASDVRNLPARHRSLRAVFERSWALLDPDEQTLLARLSVFQGGFTRPAAVAVADATPVQLAGLVDHSFLRRQADDRFDMHGLLHRYAAEQLAADPAVENNARQRHADFYAELVVQAGWELEPGDPAADEAADRDGPNVLAAWRWGVENRDASVVGRMMRWLVDYFRRRGDYSGGEAAFESAIQAFRSMDGEVEKAGLLGSLLLRLGKCIFRDRDEIGLAVGREAVALLRRADPPEPLDLAQALTAFGMSHASLGHNPEATELITEALVLLGEVENEVGVGATLRDIGYVAIGWGRPREAQRYIEESLHVLEGREQKSYVQSTYGLGLTLLMRGHYRRASALLHRTLPYFVEQGENGMAGYTGRALAELYTATGDFTSARHHFAEVNARFEPMGMGSEVSSSMFLSPGALARLAGDPKAETRLLDALATARKVGYGQHIAVSLHHLARLRHDQRDYEGALALLDEALTVARTIDFRYATALVLTAQS
ncbi:MAG: BTAD domain-containing putative transcriptional regulator, partial [Caldilineaceae bacterium]